MQLMFRGCHGIKLRLKILSSLKKLNMLQNKTSATLQSQYEELACPVKSQSDKKEYKVIQLKNGLTACLISDTTNTEEPNAFSDDSSSESGSDSNSDQMESESDSASNTDCEMEQDVKMRKVSKKEQKMAAAGLCVGVGSFSDPKDVPGLAHFLEHMVFMGSEKFPQENDFDAFIKKRGGFDNAATDCETTVFYFECLEKYLFRALDKFSQFFIAPLMKRSSLSRERESVDSEFQMALPSDSSRKEQLLMSLYNSEVPINKFTWGNKKTLQDDVSEDVLYKKLHEFRKRHYSAHRMTLVIQARLPMDQLEEYLLKCFSVIPNNSLPADNFEQYSDKIYNTSDFAKLYYVKPVKDVLKVDLTWVLPSLLKSYKSKPHQYVSWFLGHEGKGSLMSYLRKKYVDLSVKSYLAKLSIFQ